MKHLITSVVLATSLFSVGAMAQSAKFTAAWEEGKVALAEVNTNYTATGESIVGATELMSTIHVANKKELLIGVSGVANLVTFTEAKGKNGAGTTTAEAYGTLDLEVRVVPAGVDAQCGGATPEGGMIAAPGAITLASRRQTLSVTVDLDIVDIEGTCGGFEQPDCVADTLEIEGDVTVALGLDTVAAHHFNFVAPDLGQGTYDIVGCFSGSAENNVLDGLAEDTSIHAYVAIMQRMLTVQEVRAVQGDFIDFE